MRDCNSVVEWTRPGVVETSQRAWPSLEQDHTMVRPLRVGICGSDLGIVAGKHARAQTGVVLGHEFIGYVDKENGAEKNDSVLVAVCPLISCRERNDSYCQACEDGAFHICEHLQLYGVDLDGGLSEAVSVYSSLLVPFTQDVEPDIAVLAEPLAVAVHAAKELENALPRRSVIFGAGPIGLLIGFLLRMNGASPIIVEPSRSRRLEAERLGFTCVEDSDSTALEDAFGGSRPDVVIDAAGHPAVAARAVSLVKPKGEILVVGVHNEAPVVDLRAVNFKELKIHGSRVYSIEDFREAVELISRNALPLQHLTLKTVPWSEPQRAFDEAQKGDAFKVVLSLGSATSKGM